MRDWIKDFLEAVESPQLELEETIELGDDRIFTEMVLTGRGRGSGVPVELRFWLVIWFAEGKIARRQVAWTKDEALETAGLSE